MLLLLDVFGSIRGNQRPWIDHDLAILEYNLSLHSRLDLPGGRYFFFLSSLPFLWKRKRVLFPLGLYNADVIAKNQSF